MKIAITVEVERDEFLSEILGSAFETWDWWRGWEYDDGYEWDIHPTDNDLPFLTLMVEDDENEELTITKKLSVNDIVKGYVKSGAKDWQNLDAGSSDWIMQCAFFDSTEPIYG